MSQTPRIAADVANYFSGKFAEHGETARGVDWNGAESQFTRFNQLCRILPAEGKFSLNDLGCGYGAIIDHLNAHYREFSYHGYDVSEPLLAAAAKRYSKQPNVTFTTSATPTQQADYSIASGIFNARLSFDDAAWQHYIEETVETLDGTSSKGFAFNCLTSYSDAEKMRPDLYYSDPCFWFDRCKRLYSKQVALLHDYGLYEFTILVRKA